MPAKRRQRRAPSSPYGKMPDFRGMTRDVGNVALGAVGIGAITTLGLGALGAIKK